MVLWGYRARGAKCGGVSGFEVAPEFAGSVVHGKRAEGNRGATV